MSDDAYASDGSRSYLVVALAVAGVCGFVVGIAVGLACGLVLGGGLW